MPQSAVQLGKQATPNASRAMPATRATGLATPANSAPSNSRPTSDGTISNAAPMAASATAATVSSFFIQLAFRAGDRVGNGRKLLAILRGVLRRTQVEPQLVDLTGELEWTIVAILDHRYTGARVLTDVEVLIFRELDRGRVFHVFGLFPGSLEAGDALNDPEHCDGADGIRRNQLGPARELHSHAPRGCDNGKDDGDEKNLSYLDADIEKE